MAEETNIKTASEVAESFGRQERENDIDDVGDIDIDEELIRLRQKMNEMEQDVREALSAVTQANGIIQAQTQIMRANEQNIGIIGDALKNAKGADGIKVDTDADGSLTIYGGKPFTGVLYLSGNKFSNLNNNASYPWVKVDVAMGTAAEAAGPPSSPFPPNEEWYEKAQVAGDIHVTRL